MSTIAISRSHLLVAAALVVIFVAGAAWYLRQSQIHDRYVEAAADCANGRGDGRLQALDRIHGEDARPSALRLDLAMCSLSSSADRYQRALGRLR